MKRREFITLFGGAAAWPLAARAQQVDRMWRIGVLVSRAADDPQGQARLGAFQQALQQSGWSDGPNVRIDIRSGSKAESTVFRLMSALASCGHNAPLVYRRYVPGPDQVRCSKNNDLFDDLVGARR